MSGTTRRTAFIAGATGYTGSALVGELCRRGVHTRAHVRPDSARLAEWRERFERAGAQVDTTRWDEDALATTLGHARPDAVFALLGTTQARVKRARGTDSYETVDYGLTLLLLRAVERATPASRFVYLSSLGAAPNRGAYLSVRHRIEQELQQSAVPWTIVRPSFITGPDRAESRPRERLAAMMSDAVLDVAAAIGLRRLHDRYSSLTAAELASALADHAFAPGSTGRIVETAELRAGR